MKHEYMKIPSTGEEWESAADAFEEHWNFPNCIGAIDGKHVLVKHPINSGSFYFNYKSTFSTVLLALVDADYKFLYIYVWCKRRVSDGGVYRNSSLSDALENNEVNWPEKDDRGLPFAVVAADDAFPLKSYYETVSLSKFNKRKTDF